MIFVQENAFEMLSVKCRIICSGLILLNDVKMNMFDATVTKNLRPKFKVISSIWELSYLYSFFNTCVRLKGPILSGSILALTSAVVITLDAIFPDLPKTKRYLWARPPGLQEPFLQRFYKLLTQILKQNLLILLDKWWCDHVIILHMSRKLSCRDMCKFVTWCNHYIYNYRSLIYTRFHWKAHKPCVKLVLVYMNGRVVSM